MKKPVRSRTVKKGKRKSKRVNWRDAAVDLASCALFTLNYFKHLTKNGSFFSFKNGRPDFESSRRWQEKYFDALDKIGYVIDRDAYYKNLDTRKRKPSDGKRTR